MGARAISHPAWRSFGVRRGSIRAFQTLEGVIRRALAHTIPRRVFSHRNFGRSLASSIARPSSTTVQLNRSATPFWDGEYGAIGSSSIPFSLHHVIRSMSFCLSNICTYSFMHSVASPFCFM
ncbi:hypothetical protein M404DRAFT_1003393 [Pisolithus tinctorius Marx 270]|uniref:Uncharacterized protein n=1 Tax=Pisolithus tinctorius Marx 270 TaxID=870435 RepID=A0A0C3P0T9_PISTI|nr:hypothetical protein M404DRAFT_1003393 [Pisolithus tinctorius Marx 270]